MAFIDDIEKVCKEVNEEATNWTWEDFPDIYKKQKLKSHCKIHGFNRGT